jgi:diacylglycerol O-acyltransferase / wax synthase
VVIVMVFYEARAIILLRWRHRHPSVLLARQRCARPLKSRVVLGLAIPWGPADALLVDELGAKGHGEMAPAPGGRADAGAEMGLAPRRLSPEDLSILALENETVAGHGCKVVVLPGALDLDLLRSSIGGRLYRAPGLCLRLGEVGGEPWWVPDPQVDVRAHVVELDRAGAVDEAAFRAIVAGLFQQRLDRSRPLWRIDVIPRLAGGGSALIWRLHHALADGWTAMRMASAVLWDELPGVAGSGRRPPAPGSADPAVHHRLRGLLAAAREAPQPWLRSPFGGHIDARRTVAFTTVELDGLRRVAHAVDGATVNDAVLTVVAGGLRRWLEARLATSARSGSRCR